MEQLRIKCPNLTCRKILAVPVSSRGKNVRCKNCGATIRVPDRSAGSGLIGSRPAAPKKSDEPGDAAKAA